MSIECEMNIVRPEDYEGGGWIPPGSIHGGPAFDPEWKGDPVPDDEDMPSRMLEIWPRQNGKTERLDACKEAVEILRSARPGILHGGVPTAISATDILRLAEYLLTGKVAVESFSQIVPIELKAESIEEIEEMMRFKPTVDGLVDPEDVPPAVDDE